MPSHSGMSLGRGIQGTDLPPTSYPPPPPRPLPNPQVTLPSAPPPLCHPRSRFLPLPLCGACPIVGYEKCNRVVNMKCERMRASTVPCRFWHRCGRRFGRPSFGFWFAFWAVYVQCMLCGFFSINYLRSGNGQQGQPSVSLVGSDTDMGPGGLATPNRAGVCGRPPTNRPLLAVREDGGVYSPSLRSRAVRLPPTPCRVCFRPRVFNKFSHFWQKSKEL